MLLKSAAYLLRQQLFKLSEKEQQEISSLSLMTGPPRGHGIGCARLVTIDAGSRINSRSSRILCAGAVHMYMTHSRDCWFSKVRDGDERVIRLCEGDAQGRHCVIVDDLVQSGGTLLMWAEALKQQGAKSRSPSMQSGPSGIFVRIELLPVHRHANGSQITRLPSLHRLSGLKHGGAAQALRGSRAM